MGALLWRGLTNHRVAWTVESTRRMWWSQSADLAWRRPP
jgi:hypothetical protein